MRVQKSKVEGLIEQISVLEDDVTKIKVAIKTNQRNIEKIEKKLAKDEEERAANKEQIQQIQTGLASIEKDAQSVLSNFKEASVLLEEREEGMKQSKKHHDEIKAKVAKLQSAEVDLDNQIEEQERVLQDLSAKLKGWEKKLQGLTLHKIGAVDDEESAEPKEGDEAKKVDEPLRDFTPEELASFDADRLVGEMSVLEDQIQQMKPNLAAIREYYKKEEEYLGRVAELDAITAQRDQNRSEYEVQS